MAVTPFKQSDLDNALKSQSSLENQISNSPAAFSNTPPSKSDLSADVELTAVKNRVTQLQSQQAKEAWYGPSALAAADPSAQGTQNEGWLSKTLNVLQSPLRAEVGAVKGVFGMADGKNPLEAATANVLTGHETYGNVLQ